MRSALFVVSILLFGTGCSWALMESAPKNYRASTGEPRCTGTKGYAAWDMLNAGGALLVALTLPESETPSMTGGAPDPGDSRSRQMAVAIGASVLYAASAVSGFGNADKCTKARRERDMEIVRGDLPIAKPVARPRVVPVDPPPVVVPEPDRPEPTDTTSPPTEESK
jgi:hypothetical protein